MPGSELTGPRCQDSRGEGCGPARVVEGRLFVRVEPASKGLIQHLPGLTPLACFTSWRWGKWGSPMSGLVVVCV